MYRYSSFNYFNRSHLSLLLHDYYQKEKKRCVRCIFILWMGNKKEKKHHEVLIFKGCIARWLMKVNRINRNNFRSHASLPQLTLRIACLFNHPLHQSSPLVCASQTSVSDSRLRLLFIFWAYVCISQLDCHTGPCWALSPYFSFIYLIVNQVLRKRKD